jgi:PAS domain S-box-containing protein
MVIIILISHVEAFVRERVKILVNSVFEKLGLGMRAKLITLFVFIKVIPLIFISLVALNQSSKLAASLRLGTENLSQLANSALKQTGELSVNDARDALDERARINIERLSTDTARAVANFLYERDSDILTLSRLKPDYDTYKAFVENRVSAIVKQGEWKLSDDESIWVSADEPAEMPQVTSSNRENDLSFHYEPPCEPEKYYTPLYREVTYVDLSGRELIKYVSSPLMSKERKDISKKENTFIKAEEYYQELLKLKHGEIYVSDVIGAYVRSKIIGTYNHKNAEKVGISFEPEKSAFAGRENPLGKRFQGIIRWATPVTNDSGRIVGFVTMALNHDHLMEFTSHTVPTDNRYAELPDASAGNYAFIWDHKGRSIVHPRHFSIAGYNPETGDPEVPWLQDKIYDAWKASGKAYTEFIKDVPVFDNQSNYNKPASELTREGLVGLDCRYLNFAPQCTGWFDLTQNGGSGSFVILWSGLEKRNTAATIPYYTGQYAKSPRGFGFVTIGAGVADFHKPADEIQESINEIIVETDRELSAASTSALNSITKNLRTTAIHLSVSTGIMVVIVILVAIWIAGMFTKSVYTLIKGISRFRNGERHFRFDMPIKNEIGLLASSFDEMADSIVNSVTDMLVITDMNEKVVYINDIALKAINAAFENTVGKSYAEIPIYPAQTLSDPVYALKKNMETEPYFHPTYQRYYKSAAMHTYDINGNISGYIIRTNDITEVLLEQKRTENQKIILNTIFTESPDLIWYKDKTGRYLAVNPRYASLTNRSPEELVGLTNEDLFQDVLAFVDTEHDKRIIDEKEAQYVEEELLFEDGHSEILESVRIPIKDANGAVIGILGVARDISARVAVEIQLRNIKKQLEEAVDAANKANRAKSDFLAKMSHEIRTPMNAIIGMANIITIKLESHADLSKNEIKTHINQIQVSSHHLLGLLNDILDISKIEAGKIELSSEIFDLKEILNDVETIITPRCEAKRITFAINMDNIGHSFFRSDPTRLKQVLLNLLGNAVKFNQDGGSVDLTIMLMDDTKETSRIAFLITDSGIGMDEQEQSMLFKPFEQASQEITRKYGGVGLGLAISNSIVQLMGGEIKCESTKGVGSTFSFEVLLKKAESEEAGCEYPLTAIAPNMKILLVDDNTINRIVVREQLKTAGILIDEADDGDVAVQMFKDSALNEYSAIFMDIQMPKMDGYTASKAIRELDREDAKTVIIIALTANAFKEDVDKAMNNGMNAHLAKPLEFEKLLKTVSKHLKNRPKK